MYQEYVKKRKFYSYFIENTGYGGITNNYGQMKYLFSNYKKGLVFEGFDTYSDAIKFLEINNINLDSIYELKLCSETTVKFFTKKIANVIHYSAYVNNEKIYYGQSEITIDKPYNFILIQLLLDLLDFCKSKGLNIILYDNKHLVDFWSVGKNKKDFDSKINDKLNELINSKLEFEINSNGRIISLL